MGEVKVSVVIPVYNAEKFLDDCLTTLIKQSLQEIEILCVNDGSTDGSLEVLRRYEKEDARIRVFTQENQGAGAARNLGLAQAKGDYLSFLDADDFYEPDMLEQAYKVAKEKDADVCVFYADLFDTVKKEYRPCTWAFRRQYFKDQAVFSPKEHPNNINIFRMFNGWPWDKLFKREFILRQGLEYQNLRTTNDMYFVFMALAKAERIVTLDQCLIHQRVGISSSLSRTREKSWDCFYLGLQEMQRELKDTGMYETYRTAFVNWALNFSLWQLNSIGGESIGKIYNLLRDKAFEEFDLDKLPVEEFFAKGEYEQYQKIMERPLEFYLYDKITALDQEKQKLLEKNSKLEAEVKKLKTSTKGTTDPHSLKKIAKKIFK